MYFHRESTSLLGAMDRERMKDAPPEKWTGQRLCATPWEAPCSIPGGKAASLPVHCPPSTCSTLLGAARHRAEPGCIFVLPGSGLSACTNSLIWLAHSNRHVLGHWTGLIRADVPGRCGRWPLASARHLPDCPQPLWMAGATLHWPTWPKKFSRRKGPELDKKQLSH